MLAALVIIGAIVGGGYIYSRRKSGQAVFPSGYQPPIPAEEIDCAKAKPTNADTLDFFSKCDRIKLDPAAKILGLVNTELNFSFSYPDTLKLVTFPNGMGIVYKDFPTAANLLYTVELASSRSGEMASLTGEDYVRNYWRQYQGLTGISSLDSFTNNTGNIGYKAIYVLGGAKTGNQEVFFELGEKTGNFIHFPSGILEQPLFDLIVGSFKYPSE